MVVKHASPPWFTIEDGSESRPVDGLNEQDRVVAIEADAPKAGP